MLREDAAPSDLDPSRRLAGHFHSRFTSPPGDLSCTGGAVRALLDAETLLSEQGCWRRFGGRAECARERPGDPMCLEVCDSMIFATYWY